MGNYIDDFGKDLKSRGNDYIATIRLSNIDVEGYRKVLRLCANGLIPRDFMLSIPHDLMIINTEQINFDYSFHAQSQEEALGIARQKLETVASHLAGLEVSLEKLIITSDVDISSIKPIKVSKP